MTLTLLVFTNVVVAASIAWLKIPSPNKELNLFFALFLVTLILSINSFVYQLKTPTIQKKCNSLLTISLELLTILILVAYLKTPNFQKIFGHFLPTLKPYSFHFFNWLKTPNATILISLISLVTPVITIIIFLLYDRRTQFTNSKEWSLGPRRFGSFFAIGLGGSAFFLIGHLIAPIKPLTTTQYFLVASFSCLVIPFMISMLLVDWVIKPDWGVKRTKFQKGMKVVLTLCFILLFSSPLLGWIELQDLQQWANILFIISLFIIIITLIADIIRISSHQELISKILTICLIPFTIIIGLITSPLFDWLKEICEKPLVLVFLLLVFLFIVTLILSVVKTFEKLFYINLMKFLHPILFGLFILIIVPFDYWLKTTSPGEWFFGLFQMICAIWLISVSLTELAKTPRFQEWSDNILVILLVIMSLFIIILLPDIHNKIGWLKAVFRPLFIVELLIISITYAWVKIPQFKDRVKNLIMGIRKEFSHVLTERTKKVLWYVGVAILIVSSFFIKRMLGWVESSNYIAPSLSGRVIFVFAAIFFLFTGIVINLFFEGLKIYFRSKANDYRTSQNHILSVGMYCLYGILTIFDFIGNSDSSEK